MSSSNISLILPLVDAQRSQKSGTKATNLSKLIVARFAVPRGFVISADSYRSHLWASGARGAVSSTMEAEDRENLRQSIIGASVPEDIWSAVADAYHRLSLQVGVSEPKVAVRSSAIEEDGKDQLFIGAYESYLNVCGLDALQEAVKRVWASLWNGKAAAYRQRFNITSEPAMAVIVQQMIDTKWAGTISTADPVTGNPHEAIIRCSSDDGSVSYRVDLHDMSTSMTGGNGDISLDTDILLTILEKAVLIENEIGSPIEVEWTYDGDTLWVLQARRLCDMEQYFPLNWPQKCDEKCNWQRVTAKPICHFSRSHLWDDYRDPIIAFPGSKNFSKYCHLNGFVYKLKSELGESARLPSKEAAAGSSILNELERIIEPDLKSRAVDILRADLPAMEHSRFIRMLSEAAEVSFYAMKWMDLARYPLARFSTNLLNLLNDAEADTALHRKLLGGLRGTTTVRDARFQELGKRFSVAEEEGKLEDESWCRIYRSDFDKLAHDYGYSFTDPCEMYDISSWKSWIEDSDTVFRIIGATRVQDDISTLETRKSVSVQRYLDAETEAHALFKGESLSCFNKLLRLSREWLIHRVELENIYALACTALRLMLLELAERLHKSEVIAETGDIFHLELEEILALPLEIDRPMKVSIATNIARRKHEIWLERRFNAPEMLPIGSDTELNANDGNIDSVSGGNQVEPLKGCSISSGLASGRARIVSSIEEAAEIECGDILVLRSPSLSWTPFFASAGACVFEDINDALPSRECGIPVIAGCKGIIRAVRNGQRITVNGNDAVVEL